MLKVRPADTPHTSSKGRTDRITYLPDHPCIPVGQHHTLHAKKQRNKSWLEKHRQNYEHPNHTGIDPAHWNQNNKPYQTFKAYQRSTGYLSGDKHQIHNPHKEKICSVPLIFYLSEFQDENLMNWQVGLKISICIMDKSYAMIECPKWKYAYTELCQ